MNFIETVGNCECKHGVKIKLECRACNEELWNELETALKEVSRLARDEATLVKALEDAKLPEEAHFSMNCDSGRSRPGANPPIILECNCWVGEHNAAIDTALDAVKEPT